MTPRFSALALCAVLGLASCGSSEPQQGTNAGPSTAGPDGTEPELDPRVVPQQWLGDVHGQSLGQVEAPDPAADGRAIRRMDIDQLNASIRAVTGGIGWVDGDEDLFEDLASTLGRPDYDETTAEDLTPSLLFEKFLDDAANAVCEELVQRESVGEASNVYLIHVTPTDTSLSNPDAITANLQDALLRFHGNPVEASDPQLESWRWLFDTTVDVTGGDTLAGWRTVCIGLITHPDFAMY